MGVKAFSQLNLIFKTTRVPLRLSASYKYFNIFINLCSLFMIGDNNIPLIYWDAGGINIYEKKKLMVKFHRMQQPCKYHK